MVDSAPSTTASQNARTGRCGAGATRISNFVVSAAAAADVGFADAGDQAAKLMALGRGHIGEKGEPEVAKRVHDLGVEHGLIFNDETIGSFS